jgi:YesN/AraC family two-component response regulator
MYRILIVEDEELEREALKIIIKNSGLKEVEVVGETDSGLDALELHKKLKPHLILMDINIYGINGLETVERIKKVDPNIAVVIMTAYDEFDFAHKAIKNQVHDYILKPARPKKIIEVITKQMSIEVKESTSIKSMLNEMKTSIYKVDYKNTKYMLKGMVQYIFNEYSGDNENITKSLRQIAEVFLKIALDLGIYNKKNIEICRERHMINIALIHEEYEANKSLMKFLDLIFDELTRSKGNLNHNDMDRIQDYIEKNINNNITLEEVAEYASISPFYLSRLFKRKVGINFSTYIVNNKMEIAKELLKNTHIPIVNIALELSYKEPNYFSKVFKKKVGVTPTEYRNSNEILIKKHNSEKISF